MCRICPIFTPPKRQKSWGRSISQHNREVRDCAYMIIDRWLDRGSFLQQCKLVYKPHPNLDIDIETSCFPKWGDPNHPNFVLKPMVLGIAHFKKHPCLIMYDHICAVNSIMWEPTCLSFGNPGNLRWFHSEIFAGRWSSQRWYPKIRCGCSPSRITWKPHIYI